MEEDLIYKKAILLRGGSVQIPEGFQIPFRISRSTAGPGAGKRSIVFNFYGMRVKKAIVHDEAEFQLHETKDGLSLLHNHNQFLDTVEISPVVFHSPDQAFFNLDQRCKFHCLYCSSPLLDVNATKGLTKEKIVSMTKEAMKTMDVKSLALTSGVFGSVEETVERMVECVREVRSEIPELTIGVEPYVDSIHQIESLKLAGADEIKINLEIPDSKLFRIACPDLNQSLIWEMLKASVDIFGIGHVTSNIIYGLGESDEQILEAVEQMAKMGITAGLRMLVLNDINRPHVERALGKLTNPSKERMVGLAKAHKKILQKYNLDTRTFQTMCFACTCCDLVPFRDL